MLLKLGLKNLKHNLLMNILTILQMTASFIILISMISSVMSRFTYYIPFKDILDKKGQFYNVFNVINPDTGSTLRSTDEIQNLLDGNPEITAQYNAWLHYEEGSRSDYFISYDDKYVEIFKPELESGRWFDTDSPSQQTVPVVVSQNNYNFKVGDKIVLYCFDEKIDAKVIGILKENAKIIYTTENFDINIDYRSLYKNYSFEQEEKAAFLLMQKDLIDKPVVMQLNGNVMVTYPDNTAKDVIENNTIKMKMLNVLKFESNDDIKKNSQKYILSQINHITPVFVCILVLTFIGAISVSALSAKQQLKNYAIYYICGSQWKQCALVNFFSALICVSISLALSTGIIAVMIANGLLENTVIELGFRQISGCIIIALIYVILSMILPLRIIGKSTPNQVLKTN